MLYALSQVGVHEEQPAFAELSAADKTIASAGVAALPPCYTDGLHECLNPSIAAARQALDYPFELDNPLAKGGCDAINAAYGVAWEHMDDAVAELPEDVCQCATAKAGFGLLALVAVGGIAVGALATAFMRR